ncbi:MAG: tol-pal system protein YbgF [Rhodovibrio sp.]|nr:tol-pal system protein YbgF [Rhodovibrio sp.]
MPDGPPQAQYDYAFGLLRQADYAEAEQALSKFLDKHPEHELAGNAKYWLGETFYVRGNYERAAVTFAEGFQTYPESQKAPDNLLKLGMSLAQIDRTEDACGIFAELQSRYPDAKNNILQRAEREQSRLNCGQG